MMPMVRIILLSVVILFGFQPAVAELRTEEDIPPELLRWREWVLHGHEAELCPGVYDDGALTRCQWPSQLRLQASTEGGRFEQHWQLFARGWVSLPGGPDLWPDGVVVDGRPVAVVNREGIPSVELDAGGYQITGRFEWHRMPEGIQVPPASGLITLTVDGQRIEAPVIDDKGRLWLRERRTAAGEADRVGIHLFRLINDTIPMQITTLVRLDVSGQARELKLGDILLENLVPMSLESVLPTRLDREGRLLVQARPGRWEIRITGRLPGVAARLSAGAASHGDEIWVFQPQHQLRMVEVEGVPQVEPEQTELPAAWRRYSAYLIKPDAEMRLNMLRRGDPDPPPARLRLHRNWWLDFDGSGFTLHDRIEGTLSRQWYLVMRRPGQLGRVAVDGRDQVITAHGDDGLPGVELRRGILHMTSDARLARGSGSLNAVGWSHDFDGVSADLFLPPGWRLLAASGVDQASDTWLQRWSLLDFFLVLIIALAVFKLRDWRWSLLALATMVLIFHEVGAPRLVWLHLLAALALMPLLPDGWLKRLIGLWGAGAVVTLVLLTIPFSVNQVRWGFYPQLAPHNGRGPVPQDTSRAVPAPPAQALPVAPPEPDRIASLLRSAPLSAKRKLSGGIEPQEQAPVREDAVWHQDPDALIPTGPGLPDWRWHGVGLRWNGPVTGDQTMRLYLASPLANLILALIRVVLLGLMIWGVVDWRPWWRKARYRLAPAAAVMVILGLWASAPPVQAAEEPVSFPPASLLDSLRERLLTPPDCLPHCADISRMELVAVDDEIQLMVKANAATQTAIPLPSSRKSWSPGQVLLDNAPISGLARDDQGGLWAVIPAGLHTIVMQGSAVGTDLVQIPLPLKPHLATFSVDGWTLKGISADGKVGSSLLLTRVRQARGEDRRRNDAGPMPPFLHVERVLQLGLTWQVHTTVRRVTPPGVPVVASVPLLADESLTTAGLQVDKGQVLINMSADQRQLSFQSTLEVAPQVRLTAPRAVPWTETWVLDASAIWHCDLEGIPVIHHQGGSGLWQPRWRPWPGESVIIRVRRPKPLEGQAVTVQRADLEMSPGRRFSRGELHLKINSSRGGPHTLELPANANLQSVSVGGRSLPVRQDGRWVTVPLQPGVQTVGVQWHQLTPFGIHFQTPQVKIGESAVNANVAVKMPQSRWILFAGGPRWGPAVLFWSYLAVIVLAALGLGRLTLTPLKTWQWALLGLGLTQIPAPVALVIVGWLLVLGLRRNQPMPGHWLGFDLLQIGLALWTLVALTALFSAVKAGLIGQPEMQVAGNGSTQWVLNWTQDRIDTDMPRPWILSLPIWCYRGLMLAWSFWLAFALLGWLKWGWDCFARDGVWRKLPRRSKGGAAKTVEPEGSTPAS